MHVRTNIIFIHFQQETMSTKESVRVLNCFPTCLSWAPRFHGHGSCILSAAFWFQLLRSRFLGSSTQFSVAFGRCLVFVRCVGCFHLRRLRCVCRCFLFFFGGRPCPGRMAAPAAAPKRHGSSGGRLGRRGGQDGTEKVQKRQKQGD